MRLLLDTNRYTDLAKGIAEVSVRATAAEELWPSVISVGELRAGFAGGSRSERNEAIFNDFVSRKNAGVLLLDEATAATYGQILAKLRRAGTPIPTNDIWIAAVAIQHNLVLDTRDEHFKKVTGLQLA